MDESPILRRRVRDDALRSVNLERVGTKALRLTPVGSDGTYHEAPANSVPAAAVIRGEQALFGITGRKGRLGGVVSQR